MFTVEVLSYLRLPALASSGLVVALTGLLYAKQKYDLIPLNILRTRETSALVDREDGDADVAPVPSSTLVICPPGLGLRC